MTGALWTAADIAAATGGVAQGDFAVNGVTFDSREVIGGELFVALKGETTDGHRFIDGAKARGAAGFLVSEAVDAPHVRVADTMAALEALGRTARARTDATVIGVTGSVGKTSVKEALRLAFERQAADHVHASVKSYNNHTGVPLSLSRMPSSTRFGVFEMGMNHAGELAQLTQLVRPHVAVVTWIASAHRAFFASDEAIADAKGEIFAGLMPGGTAIIPFDSPHRDRLIGHARPHAAEIVTFGEGAGADVRALHVALGADGSDVVVDLGGDQQLVMHVAAAGRHWVNNSLAVIAAVRAAGGDVGQAALALAELPGLAGRGRRAELVVDGGKALLIDEAYNANPVSMAAALAVLGGVASNGRRIAVLGAMRELGDESDRFHAELAAPIRAAGVATAILVGPEMEPLAKLLQDGCEVAHVPDSAAALDAVRAVLSPGDAVLVKGSNSVGLSRLVAQLTGSTD